MGKEMVMEILTACSESLVQGIMDGEKAEVDNNIVMELQEMLSGNRLEEQEKAQKRAQEGVEA